MNILETQNIRKVFLLKLYETTQGDRWIMPIMYNIGNSIGLDKNTTLRITDYLNAKGLIEIMTGDRDIRITVEGIDEAEAILGGGNDILLNEDLQNQLNEIKDQLNLISAGQEVLFNEIEDRFKNINKVSKKDFKTIILSVFFSKGIDALTISKLLDYL